MINFSTLQGLTIPEGVVTQIADASGRVLWKKNGFEVVFDLGTVTFTKHFIFNRYDVTMDVSAIPSNADLINALRINDEIIPLPYSKEQSGTVTRSNVESIPLVPAAGEFTAETNTTLNAISVNTGADLGTCDVALGIV